MTSMKICRVEKIHGHPWIRAVAVVEWHGLQISGLKLEQHPEGWRLTAPGRRLNGEWQTLVRFTDRSVEQMLLEAVRLRHG